MTDIKDPSGRGFLLAYIELQKEQIQASQQQLERYANDFNYLLLAGDDGGIATPKNNVNWQNNCQNSGSCIEHVAGLSLKIARYIGQSATYCKDLSDATRAFMLIQHGMRVEHTERVSILALEIGLFRKGWFNGKGTPNNIVGKKIPLASRIFALAEYATSITDACRQEGKSSFEGRESLKELLHLSSGRIFDPDLVDALLAILEEGEES